MAAPTLQAEGAQNQVTTGTLTLTLPAHQTDDILVCIVLFWLPATVGSAATIPDLSGWTKAGSVMFPGTPDGEVAFFWRRAVSGAETNPTFTRGAGWDTGSDGIYGGRAHVVRGCVTTGDPWDELDPTVALTAANGACDAVTVSGSQRMVVQFLGKTDDFVTAPTISGWTAGSQTESTAGTDSSYGTFRKDNVSSSTTADASTVEAPAAGAYVFFGVSFAPAPAVVDVDGNRPTTADLTGTAAVDHTVDGTRPVTVTFDGQAAVDVAVAGDRPITVAATGDIDVVGGGGVVNVDGSLAVTADRVGTAAADHTVVGTRPTTVGLTGAAAVDIAVGDHRPVTAGLSGTATVDHMVDGARPVSVAIAGQAALEAAVDGNRPVTAALTGSIDVTEPGQVDVNGNLTIAVSLTGAAVNETEVYMGAAADAPCTPWTPTWCINPGALTPAVVAATGIGVQVASDLLWTLSGRRYGVCQATIRPCRRECWPTYGPGWGWWSAASGWAAWPWPVNLGGGIWVNCGCNTCGDTCSCSPLSEVVLPYPIASIVEIVIDGQTLPASGYAVWDHRIVTRVDGGVFPTCNDLEITSPPGGVGAWHITATYGVSVPPSGMLAVGQLALEIAKDCAGQACALPRNVTSITRQGVSQSFDTRMPRIVFGLPMVDAFLSAKNPAGITAPAKIFGMDGPRHRSRTGP